MDKISKVSRAGSLRLLALFGQRRRYRWCDIEAVAF